MNDDKFTLKDEAPWEVRSEFELGYAYEPSDMSWDVFEGEHKVMGVRPVR